MTLNPGARQQVWAHSPRKPTFDFPDSHRLRKIAHCSSEVSASRTLHLHSLSPRRSLPSQLHSIPAQVCEQDQSPWIISRSQNLVLLSRGSKPVFTFPSLAKHPVLRHFLFAILNTFQKNPEDILVWKLKALSLNKGCFSHHHYSFRCKNKTKQTIQKLINAFSEDHI